MILPGTGRGTIRRMVEGGLPQSRRPAAFPLHHPLRGRSLSPFLGGTGQ
jgi:hypothetical protein